MDKITKGIIYIIGGTLGVFVYFLLVIFTELNYNVLGIIGSLLG